MDPRHARYPFFEAAREAVGEAGVDLPTLVAADDAAVDRGRERVERALTAGRTDPETPGRWSTRDELLSYPLARILVSLLDSDAAVRKYAAAEAATARERFREDVGGDDGLRSTASTAVPLADVLREFDLEGVVRAETGGSGGGSRRGARSSGPASGAGGDGGRAGRPGDAERFRVGVGRYLGLSDPDWGDGWRLVNRDLVGGEVRVDREELFRLLGEAVRERVAAGLPFAVRDRSGDEALAEELEDELGSLRGMLADRTAAGGIDTVVPSLFPPCMTNLVERARRGVELDPPESFALMAFLTGIGMDAEDVIAFCEESSLDREGIRFQVRYLRDDRGAQYPPPSCETLANYGICHNEDDHWAVAAHPLVYYEKRLAAADDVVDWRERRAAGD